MLYWLFKVLGGDEYVPVLNLLNYTTFRMGLTLITAQLIVILMGSRFIRWMRTKQGKGQPIRAEGIQRHVLEKAGTPTMGGFMILAGLLGGVLLWADLTNVHIWVVIMVTAGYGVLGFLDDYAKVTKQTTAGVSGRVKLLFQFAIALAAVLLLMVHTPTASSTPGLVTSVAFPFFKSLLLNLGYFYLAFAAFVIVGSSNAVNMTDGLDGLAIVPVMFAAASLGAIAYVVGNINASTYLNVHFVGGASELAVFCAGVIGCGLGFLWYNAPPAKIFMGDTGSLALGGALGAVAVCAKHELVLAIIGGLFVLEAMSVMIQVAYFRLSGGKRIFLMAPIHHHFEKLGWPESTVVIRFWIVSVMLAIAGLATLKLR